ncbi:MAG: FecR domain-containing protein [Dehalococcoidales bacterium]|nr:FecR domain-containing protein [Dehalococcoidales bacterium]
MSYDILTVLDVCLERVRGGETAEQCLTDYPEYRKELISLLKTALVLKSVPETSPSFEFRSTSRARIMSRIRTESVWQVSPSAGKAGLHVRFNLRWKFLVPAALAVLVIIIVFAGLPLLAPEPVSAAEFTLSLLSGSADVKTGESSDWASGSDGQILHAGSRIRSCPDSFCVLTFFNGSMIKLEPEAEVLVSKSEYVDRRSSFIVLEQESGSTWSYIAPEGEDKPYFAIRTAYGNAMARGTAFSTVIDDSGYTRFAVMEGAIQVTEGDREIMLEADMQIEVGDTGMLSSPLPIPQTGDELVFSTGLTGIGSVRDPSGASTGMFPYGLTFNQITNSKSLVSSDKQQILVEGPAPGEYLLTVRGVSGEGIPVNIQVRHDGLTVYQFEETLEVPSGDGWIIHFKLDAENQSSFKGNILSIMPLTGEDPENVVAPALAIERAVPVYEITSPEDSPDIETSPVVIPEDAIPGQPSPSLTPAAENKNEDNNGNSEKQAVLTPITTPDITPLATPAAITTTPIPSPVSNQGDAAVTPRKNVQQVPAETTTGEHGKESGNEAVDSHDTPESQPEKTRAVEPAKNTPVIPDKTKAEESETADTPKPGQAKAPPEENNPRETTETTRPGPTKTDVPVP